MENAFFSLIFMVIINSFAEAYSKTKPHIIVILADDLGWNDVSFHGSNQIPTPNIDALAFNGIILNQHYVQALCTPSRAAFLTGKYPIHLGMHHDVILENAPWGLGLDETLMPQYFREAGYSTHAIGKWHLGYFKSEYTPTFRGFDTHFGYWNGLQDYYNHLVYTTVMSGNFSNIKGYDMRRNMEVDYASNGSYSTDIFTKEAVEIINRHDSNNPMFLYFSHLAPHAGCQINPLQAPDEEIAKFGYINDPERRTYAAMVSLMDKSVGDVVEALRSKNMLDNSIILFLADNGGQTWGVHANHASNYPLRGMKASPWEGGVRGVAAVWSPLLKKKQRVSSQMMHITDWLPTLLSAAGVNQTVVKDIDGIDMWETLSNDKGKGRSEFVVNIDDLDNYASIRVEQWKYVNGSPDITQEHWYGEVGRDVPYENYAKDVLFSQVGISLIGWATKQQIQDKKRGSNYTEHLLSHEKLDQLRQGALVKCDSEEVSPELLCVPMTSPCLFDILSDPCERRNVASRNTAILAGIEDKLAQYRSEVLSPRNKPADPNADPRHWNGVWVNWQDRIRHKRPEEMTIITLGIVVILFVIVIIMLLAISIKGSNSSLNQNMQVGRILRSFDSKTKLRRNPDNRERRCDLFSELEIPTTPTIRTIN